VFRTETLRTDLAFATNQGEAQVSSDFPGIQSGVRANFGYVEPAESSPAIAGSPIRVDLGRISVSGSSTKAQRIASVSTEQVLTLSSEYWQFLTPTVASVVVKLPSVTGSDYFECEIANISTVNALEIQEFNGTAVLPLANTGDKARSIYVYWDGSTWQVWIRGYY
jgi:hypothetical protein